MRKLSTRTAAQPPSDFVPPEPSSNKKYLWWGCGGCSLMIILGVVGFGLVAYKGCEVVSNEISALTAGGTTLHKTDAFLQGEIEKGDLKKIYEVMAPWYVKKTPFEEFKAQLDPYLGVMKSTFVRSEVEYRGNTDQAKQDISLFYIPEMKNGVATVGPDGLQKTLVVSFTCSFVQDKKSDVEGIWKEVSEGGVTCPLALSSIEEVAKPINLEPSVRVALKLIDELRNDRSSEIIFQRKELIDTKSFTGGGAEFDSYAAELKKLTQNQQLYVKYRRFVIPEEGDPAKSVEVAFFDEATKEPVVSVMVKQIPYNPDLVVASDLSKKPSKNP